MPPPTGVCRTENGGTPPRVFYRTRWIGTGFEQVPRNRRRCVSVTKAPWHPHLRTSAGSDDPPNKHPRAHPSPQRALTVRFLNPFKKRGGSSDIYRAFSMQWLKEWKGGERERTSRTDRRPDHPPLAPGGRRTIPPLLYSNAQGSMKTSPSSARTPRRMDV